MRVLRPIVGWNILRSPFSNIAQMKEMVQTWLLALYEKTAYKSSGAFCLGLETVILDSLFPLLFSAIVQQNKLETQITIDSVSLYLSLEYMRGKVGMTPKTLES